MKNNVVCLLIIIFGIQGCNNQNVILNIKKTDFEAKYLYCLQNIKNVWIFGKSVDVKLLEKSIFYLESVSKIYLDARNSDKIHDFHSINRGEIIEKIIQWNNWLDKNKSRYTVIQSDSIVKMEATKYFLNKKSQIDYDFWYKNSIDRNQEAFNRIINQIQSAKLNINISLDIVNELYLTSFIIRYNKDFFYFFSFDQVVIQKSNDEIIIKFILDFPRFRKLIIYYSNKKIERYYSPKSNWYITDSICVSF